MAVFYCCLPKALRDRLSDKGIHNVGGVFDRVRAIYLVYMPGLGGAVHFLLAVDGVKATLEREDENPFEMITY